MTLEAWFDATCGGYRVTDVTAKDLPPGAHRIRIELPDDKYPESAGHEFRLLGLGTAEADSQSLSERWYIALPRRTRG